MPHVRTTFLIPCASSLRSSQSIRPREVKALSLDPLLLEEELDFGLCRAVPAEVGHRLRAEVDVLGLEAGDVLEPQTEIDHPGGVAAAEAGSRRVLRRSVPTIENPALVEVVQHQERDAGSPHTLDQVPGGRDATSPWWS